MNACPTCGEVIDVSVCEPYSKVLCPSCGTPIRVRGEFLNFQIKKRIGEGGMSRVFRAVDKTLDRKVALKILNPDFAEDARRAREFEREAKITASISHPNVVKVYSAGRDQDHYFIAMELVPGGSLDEKISAKGALREEDVLQMAGELVNGLSAALEAGLIHRDMKPGNVLFSEDGTSKIVDFGLALDLASTGEDNGEIWATPYYVPPEKLHREPEDFRSDIYSLGATLFHALAGKPPYSADTSSIEELKAIKDKPISLEISAPRVSMSTCELVDRMMARRPGDRYASYKELADHIKFARQKLAESGGSHVGVATRRMRRRVEERNAMTAAVVAFSVVASLLGILLGLHFYHRSTQKPSGNGGGGSGGSGGALVIDGGETTTQRFEAGRQLLLTGNYGKAEQAFGAIAADGATVQPTLNWALFNEGLSKLLQGKTKEARGVYARLSAAAKSVQEMGEADSLNGFFVRAADLLASPLPIQAEDQRHFDPTGGEAAAYFAFGLKNWEMGSFATAQSYLRAFRDSKPEREPWVADFQTLLGPYLRDLDLIATMSPFDRRADFSAALELLGKSKGILRQLTLDSGKARIRKRIDRLESWVNRLQTEQRINQKRRLDQLKAAEGKLFAQLKHELREFRDTTHLKKGAEKLQESVFGHPEIKAQHANQLRLWKGADAFLDTLVDDLNRFGYTGEVELTVGSRPNWTIVEATRERIRYEVAGGAGQGAASLPGISNASLLTIADNMAAKAGNAGAKQRLEQRACFAHIVGEDAAAAAAAATCDEEFKDFWRRIQGE